MSDGVDESSMLRLDPDEELKLDGQDSIVLNPTLTIPETILELPTKSNVDNKINDHSRKKTLLLTLTIKISITFVLAK